MDGLKQSGQLYRHKRLLSEYCRLFHVVAYSCDDYDYSEILEVEHHPIRWLPKLFGFRHLIFFLYLIWKAPFMRGVIKVFGSNVPVLPLVKILSNCPIMVTFQYDNSTLMEQTYGKMAIITILSKLMDYLSLKSADLVLVTTSLLELKVKHSYKKPTVLLPNWVDVRACIDVLQNNLRQSRKIIFAGRLNKIKGVDVLIRAFAEVKKSYPEASLDICGIGEERESLEELKNTLRIVDVKFTGSILNAEILKKMATASIFILPTVASEGHPKALIEAMACGDVCIATNVPGNRDVIIDSENGLLVPPNDVQVLSKSIKEIFTDDALRLRLSHNAQLFAVKYDLRKIVPEEIKVLLALK